MTEKEQIEVLANALRFYSKNWWKQVVVVDEKTVCRSVHLIVPPDTGWTARNALETVGLLPPSPPDITWKPAYGANGIWDYERCGYKTHEWSKDENGKKIIVEVFTPACLKCLTKGVELNACASCGHERSMGTKIRLFCDKCLKSHKNPRDCSDCTSV